MYKTIRFEPHVVPLVIGKGRGNSQGKISEAEFSQYSVTEGKQLTAWTSLKDARKKDELDAGPCLICCIASSCFAAVRAPRGESRRQPSRFDCFDLGRLSFFFAARV